MCRTLKMRHTRVAHDCNNTAVTYICGLLRLSCALLTTCMDSVFTNSGAKLASPLKACGATMQPMHHVHILDYPPKYVLPLLDQLHPCYNVMKAGMVALIACPKQPCTINASRLTITEGAVQYNIPCPTSIQPLHVHPHFPHSHATAC